MIKSLVAVALTSLFLSGCGGGGGSGNSGSSGPSATPTPPVVRTAKLQYGYWYNWDNEAVETADHVSYIFIPDGGDWDTQVELIQLRQIAQLQDAKARGITKAIVMVGYLTWTKAWVVKDKAGLVAFRTQLEALGLLDMVEVIYPMDEPDVQMHQHGLTAASFDLGVGVVASVFPDRRLMVIYGHSGGYPSQSRFHVVGTDNYGNGVVTLPLLFGQTEALLIGGADPWREDPTPVVDYAVGHPEVEFIVVFTYGDYGPKGVRNNGMLPIYRAQGLRVKALK